MLQTNHSATVWGLASIRRHDAVAYLAGVFPSQSETFVYREVRELHSRGWRICAVSLNVPDERGLAGLEDVAAGVHVVYGPLWYRTARTAVAEMLARPWRSLCTLARAVGDSVWPGEPLGLRGRGKLIVQALAGLGLARHLRAQEVQHIHCHFAHAPTTVGMYAARQLGVPFSFTGHANDIFRRRCLLKRKLQRAAFVSCISRWHRKFYRQIEPGADAKYRIVRCGVPLDAWSHRKRPQSSRKNQPFHLLCVARLVEKKGVESLIRAVATLEPSIAWRLTIVGDGPLRSRLESLAVQFRLGDRVTWKGAVNNDEVRRLMESADLFVLPCRVDSEGDRDGIPVAIMEAMASGLPVVAGRIPGFDELVVEDVTGLMCDGADERSVAGAIAGLMLDRERCAAMGRAGHERVEAEFSLKGNVTRLEESIRHCLCAGPGAEVEEVLE